MAGIVIPGETEAQRGEATCLDSSSSQVASLGFELKSADYKRHVKKIRGLSEEEQTKWFLWKVLGVSWEARQAGMN